MARKLSEESRTKKHKYDIEYHATHSIRVPISLNAEKDADILAFLQTLDNKQGLVKELLRRHMNEIGFVYEPSAQEE